MSPDQVADVLGAMTFVGVLGLVVLGGAAAVPALRHRIVEPLVGSATLLAAGVALLATIGSLWFSEGAHFPPCQLCWYQRIAMYPLVVVLAVATVSRDRSGRVTGLIIATVGLAVSIWHNVIETFPDLDSGTSCDPTNPCTIRWVEGLGLWTIPRMALVCFAAIIALVLVDHLGERSATEEQDEPAVPS